jgi:ABC-2 type transport system permease protein
MNHLPLIIKREYLNKVRNKSFIIMTFLSPLIFVGIFALVGYLSSVNNDNVRNISVYDESGMFANSFEDTATENYNLLTNLTLEQAKAIGKDTDTYGLLYIPKTENLEGLSKSATFFSEESPSLGLMKDVERIIERQVNNDILKRENIDSDRIKQLRLEVEIRQNHL